MFEAPMDLANARLLITNDDGILAPGLRTMENIARAISDDVWVVAPTTEQSGVGHALSLHAPIRIHQRSERHYNIDGSPTDCVLIAISKILRDHPPDLVLSGVNRGGNLGDDVTYSGTVAAAMEATLLGVPAIAFSQVYTYDHPVKWATAEHHAGPIIRTLTRTQWPSDVFVNVNFPDATAASIEGVEVVRQGRRMLGYNLVGREDPRGRPYIWIGPARNDPGDELDTDLARSAQGAITVTPMQVDLTHPGMMQSLSQVFE